MFTYIAMTPTRPARQTRLAGVLRLLAATAALAFACSLPEGWAPLTQLLSPLH